MTRMTTENIKNKKINLILLRRAQDGLTLLVEIEFSLIWIVRIIVIAICYQFLFYDIFQLLIVSFQLNYSVNQLLWMLRFYKLLTMQIIIRSLTSFVNFSNSLFVVAFFFRFTNIAKFSSISIFEVNSILKY